MEQEQATLTAVNDLCKNLFEKKEELDSYKRIVDTKTKELEELKKKALAHLEGSELKTFKSEYGTITCRDNFSIKVPKLEESRNELRSGLEAKKVFDSMWTVNSATLNAYWKRELELAVERGDVDWKMPGVDEPKHYSTLSMTKAR